MYKISVTKKVDITSDIVNLNFFDRELVITGRINTKNSAFKECVFVLVGPDASFYNENSKTEKCRWVNIIKDLKEDEQKS